MAIVALSEVAAAPAAEDPFRYGWRYLRHQRPDGTVELEQVPLTLEDVLHPQEGDFIMQTDQHHRLCTYLYDVLSAHLATDPTAVVLSDVRILWDDAELKAHGPDIMVIFGVQERKNWSTFQVAAEGVRPTLIIEVTSPDTRQHDLVDKMDAYDMAGVRRYIIIDLVKRRGKEVTRLIGYRQTPSTYEPLTLDEQGRLQLEPLRLWLGRDAANNVVCYNETGAPVGDYPQVASQLATTSAQLAEASAQLAETSAQLAEEQQARIEAERQAAELAERLRMLEAQQGQNP